MITRTHYINQIRPFFESDLIKVITGIRRCGKSVILSQIADEYRSKGQAVLYINFESLEYSAAIPDATTLESYVKERLSPNKKLYVFLDEVQLVDSWNIACRSLRLENLSLFISGSNSKLLSKEFTKELSGRYVSFCVRPFVYKEICAYASQLGKSYDISDYLLYGGFPKVIEFSDKASILQYLHDLNQTIIINDIMNRYKIRKTELFKRLVNYVLISNARIFSANSVQHFLSSEKLSCSINTVMKYLSYLEEAYVIRKVPQFSSRSKRELAFFAKIYDEDVSFNTIRQRNGRFDLTHNLENIIYNELIYMGYEVAVFTKGEQEIDFLASKDGKEYLVQAAYSIAAESTYEREFSLFNSLDQSRKKIIITNDDVDYSTSTVEHIKLKNFLLMNSLDK
ncbi:MAG: ATP-binding protein [Clostridiales bacterium]|nr:ATP-binding protein [Clostridiales bacterium]MDD7432414.1 ATP-binding protein [Clostridiales bacterium]MDY3061848.1 ATP-binding protein [Eubacteriales bacterium]